MINLIVGGKGSGKTKQMVELISEAIKTTTGNIVCIEKGMNLTYNLDHKCRLVDMGEYFIDGYDMLYGFIAGVFAGNYDIVELYIDGVLKVGKHNLEGLGKLLDKIEKLAGDAIKITVTVSAELENLPQEVKKYL